MKTLWLVVVLGLASPALAAETSASLQPSASNAPSLGFAHIDFQRESKDGQTVMVVTGDIINKTDRKSPVPAMVRVTLSDAANHELYHWYFPTNVQTLAPGKSVPFLTRLSEPPAAARHLDMHFAKNG